MAKKCAICGTKIHWYDEGSGVDKKGRNICADCCDRIEGKIKQQKEGKKNPKFCSECSAPLEPEDEFCPSCGNKIEKQKDSS